MTLTELSGPESLALQHISLAKLRKLNLRSSVTIPKGASLSFVWCYFKKCTRANPSQICNHLRQRKLLRQKGVTELRVHKKSWESESRRVRLRRSLANWKCLQSKFCVFLKLLSSITRHALDLKTVTRKFYRKHASCRTCLNFYSWVQSKW